MERHLNEALKKLGNGFRGTKPAITVYDPIKQIVGKLYIAPIEFGELKTSVRLHNIGVLRLINDVEKNNKEVEFFNFKMKESIFGADFDDEEVGARKLIKEQLEKSGHFERLSTKFRNLVDDNDCNIDHIRMTMDNRFIVLGSNYVCTRVVCDEDDIFVPKKNIQKTNIRRAQTIIVLCWTLANDNFHKLYKNMTDIKDIFVQPPTSMPGSLHTLAMISNNRIISLQETRQNHCLVIPVQMMYNKNLFANVVRKIQIDEQSFKKLGCSYMDFNAALPIDGKKLKTFKSYNFGINESVYKKISEYLNVSLEGFCSKISLISFALKLAAIDYHVRFIETGKDTLIMHGKLTFLCAVLIHGCRTIDCFETVQLLISNDRVPGICRHALEDFQENPIMKKTEFVYDVCIKFFNAIMEEFKLQDSDSFVDVLYKAITQSIFANNYINTKFTIYLLRNCGDHFTDKRYAFEHNTIEYGDYVANNGSEIITMHKETIRVNKVLGNGDFVYGIDLVTGNFVYAYIGKNDNETGWISLKPGYVPLSIYITKQAAGLISKAKNIAKVNAFIEELDDANLAFKNNTGLLSVYTNINGSFRIMLTEPTVRHISKGLGVSEYIRNFLDCAEQKNNLTGMFEFNMPSNIGRESRLKSSSRQCLEHFVASNKRRMEAGDFGDIFEAN